MNEMNQKMIDETIKNFNYIYDIAKKNEIIIKNVDVDQMFLNIKLMFEDIQHVKSINAKQVLINELKCMFDNAHSIVKSIINAYNEVNIKITTISSKMPLSKDKVANIMKEYNFCNNENEDNDKIQKDHNGILYLNHLKPKFTPITKEDITSGIINAPSDFDHTSDIAPLIIDNLEKMGFNLKNNIEEKIYDDLNGNDVNDSDVAEDDVKEITSEQFMNVVDDTKKLANKLKLVNELKNSNNKTVKRKKSGRRKKSK